MSATNVVLGWLIDHAIHLHCRRCATRLQIGLKSYRHISSESATHMLQPVHGRSTFLTLNTHIRLSRSPVFVSQFKILRNDTAFCSTRPSYRW